MLRNLAFTTCLVLFYLPLGSEGEAQLPDEPSKDAAIQTVVQSFAKKEKEFQQAREQYAYIQDVTVTASCEGSRPRVYHSVVELTPDGKGNRVAKIKAEDSTLECLSITEEDVEGFRNQSLILLTTDEIPDYQIKLVGQQQQDNQRFYVFDVSPISVKVGKPQFEGRIWVDSSDFVIVKSRGTIDVKREKKRKGEDKSLPAVTVWREQIDGRYWFPAYGRSSGVLHFSMGADAQVDEVLKLTNYKVIANSK